MYSSGSALLKRLVDFTASLFGILLLSPLFLLLALLVRLFGEQGPVFFVQERATIWNRPFRMLKFRSMRQGAEQKSRKGLPVEGEITRFGTVFRNIYLDELPQLFNVLKGEMTLVGLRPKPLYELEKLTRNNPVWNARGRVKAGMTSLSCLLLWMPSMGRKILPQTSEAAKVLRDAAHYNFLTADLYYVKHCSLKMDAAILLYTLVLVARKMLGLAR